MARKASMFLNWIENVMAVIAGILILISMFSVILEVITRFFWNYSSVWVQEYNEYILLYIPFLAGAWLLRQNGHVAVDIINNFLNRKMEMVLNSIVALIGIIVMVVICYYGTLATVDAFARGVNSTTPLKTPQVYIYIIIPVGSFFLLLEFIRKFFTALNVENRVSND